MDALGNLFFSGDATATMLGVTVFLAVAILAFGAMAGVHARSLVKRRAATISVGSADGAGGPVNSGVKAAKRLLDYTTKHYSSVDSDDTKALRKRLIQAGIFD